MTRVLVVDDNTRNRKLARDVLDVAGFDMLEAATGVEALERGDEILHVGDPFADMPQEHIVRHVDVGPGSARAPHEVDRRSFEVRRGRNIALRTACMQKE